KFDKRYFLKLIWLRGYNIGDCCSATIAACVVCRGMLLLSTSFWHGLKLIEFLVKQLLRYTVCCRISENVPRFCCLSEDLENSKDSLIDRRHNSTHRMGLADDAVRTIRINGRSYVNFYTR
ncbi:hypothetical protein SFRURICE_000136, partial [Spodoptera frugiperda]